MKKLITKLAGAVAIASFVGVASAVPLSTLIANPNNSLTVGDKTFDNFSASTTFGGPGASAINLALVDISVVGDGTAGNLYGIRITGDFNLTSPLGAAFEDLLLEYRVRTDGSALISAIQQSLLTSGSGTWGSSIQETASPNQSGIPADANSVVAGSAFGSDPSDPPGEVNDKLVLTTPLQTVWVSKDINLQAGSDAAGGSPATGGQVSISRIDQRFEQTGVPDGGMTVILLGAALSGIALIRRRLLA